MKILVGGIKGGSGKTTIATNLTVIRSSVGKKILLTDADEQKSASSWSQQREIEGIETPWTTIQLSGSAIRNQIQKMAKDYDDIIIDVGGRDTTSQRSALTIADIFIIPFQPRSLDIWTLGQVKTLIADVLAINPFLVCIGVINRGDSQGNDNNEALEILNDCPNLMCSPPTICQRKAFANAATDGLGVIEMKNKDQKAISEIMSLHALICQNDSKKISK